MLLKLSEFQLEVDIISIFFIGAWTSFRLITDKHGLCGFEIRAWTMQLWEDLILQETCLSLHTYWLEHLNINVIKILLMSAISGISPL